MSSRNQIRNLVRFRFFQTRHAEGNHVNTAWALMRPLAMPALVVGTVVLGSVSGLLAPSLSGRVTGWILGGLVLALLVVNGSEFVILLLMLTTSALVDADSLPNLFGFSAFDLILFVLVGLVGLRLLTKEKNKLVRTPLDVPMLLFLTAIVLAQINAAYIQKTIQHFRNFVFEPFLIYIVFFAVTHLVTSRRQLTRLVSGMFVIATSVAVLMTAQEIVGASGLINLFPGVGATVQSDLGPNVVRVYPGTTGTVAVMFLPALILQATPAYLRGFKWLSLISIPSLALAILFTFTRSLWLGIAMSSIIYVVMARGRSKDFVRLIVVWAIVAMAFTSFLSAYSPRIGNMIGSLASRAGSLFAGNELITSSSVQWRLQEDALAIAKIAQYPFLGIGIGSDYRLPFFQGDGLTYYIHNAYLGLLMDVGIAGFLPLVGLSAIFLVRSWYYWFKLEDPTLKSIVVSFTLSYTVVLFSSVTSPRLFELGYIPLIGMMLGINEVAIKLGQSSLETKYGTT